jgi:NADH-quinone oxidoreductase subunit A
VRILDLFRFLWGGLRGGARRSAARHRRLHRRAADRSSRPRPEKLLTYECGIDPVGDGWSQSQIRYYVYGFLFVIFDVESVFLFPWAKVFQSLGYTAVVEMTIFIAILGVGLLYAWRKGVLKWA